MREALNSRPQTDGIWLFAYGSLIWNPLLDFTQEHVSELLGRHRSFCLHMVSGRGRSERPELMLSLVPGGSTHGVPMDVVSLTTGAASVAAGGGHTCGATTGGGVQC
ncbi:gamma-glutamylcyclotransferase (plasmid) [Cupriavidus necator]|nr:gamma-glutamylcyclotransferase [Cupriavidus necator]